MINPDIADDEDRYQHGRYLRRSNEVSPFGAVRRPMWWRSARNKPGSAESAATTAAFARHVEHGEAEPPAKRWRANRSAVVTVASGTMARIPDDWRTVSATYDGAWNAKAALRGDEAVARRIFRRGSRSSTARSRRRARAARQADRAVAAAWGTLGGPETVLAPILPRFSAGQPLRAQDDRMRQFPDLPAELRTLGVKVWFLKSSLGV
jgi:hypothetical protein